MASIQEYARQTLSPMAFSELCNAIQTSQSLLWEHLDQVGWGKVGRWLIIRSRLGGGVFTTRMLPPSQSLLSEHLDQVGFGSGSGFPDPNHAPKIPDFLNPQMCLPSLLLLWEHLDQVGGWLVGCMAVCKMHRTQVYGCTRSWGGMDPRSWVFGG